MITNKEHEKLEMQHAELMTKYLCAKKEVEILKSQLPATPKSTLSERLTIAVEHKDCSQIALAKACGITPTSVHLWLSGATATMDAQNAIYASKFLGVRIEWLVLGEGEMK